MTQPSGGRPPIRSSDAARQLDVPTVNKLLDTPFGPHVGLDDFEQTPVPAPANLAPGVLDTYARHIGGTILAGTADALRSFLSDPTIQEQTLLEVPNHVWIADESAAGGLVAGLRRILGLSENGVLRDDTAPAGDNTPDDPLGTKVSRFSWQPRDGAQPQHMLWIEEARIEDAEIHRTVSVTRDRTALPSARRATLDRVNRYSLREELLVQRYLEMTRFRGPDAINELRLNRWTAPTLRDVWEATHPDELPHIRNGTYEQRRDSIPH